MIHCNYAVQLCDIKSYQGQKRFCGDDRTLLSKKSITSLLESIKYCVDKKNEVIHHVCIINDHSSEILIDYVQSIIKRYSSDNISIEVKNLSDKFGIAASIKECYMWLQSNGKDFVYQVQDDYLFKKNAIYEMLDLFYQKYNETNNHIIISPYNDSWLWEGPYRNRSTPREIIRAKYRYWIQYYDMSCSFMTTHQEFSKHWDLYEAFLYLVDHRNGNDLENKTLNYILTQRNIKGFVPVESLAFHMQSDLEKDPFQDWKPYWDNVGELLC